MSTIAGMFYIRSGTPGQDTPPSGCSVAESENNLSEDDNTSCSASEMGCDLTVAPSKESSSSSRKNKRKNFMPRNIMEYAGSDEEEDNAAAAGRNRLNHHHRCNNNNNNSGSNNNNNNIRMAMDADEDENDNTENDNDIDIDCGDQDDEDDVDRPLDLSEVQNDSKLLWRKPESLINPLVHINHNNNSINSTNNNSQSSLQHSPHLGNSFVFAPMAMDLRLSNSRHNSSSHAEELYEDRSNDLMISSTSSSNTSNHHGMPLAGSAGANAPGSAGLPSGGGSAALTDFAESTMKELLGLYGIAENLRQAGKPSPEIAGIQRNLESPGQPTKMMLPENMARFLAAMQETVTAAAQTGGSGVGGGPGGVGGSGGGSHHHQNCSSSNASNNNNTPNNNHHSVMNSNMSNNSNTSGSNSGSPSSLNLNVNPLSFASISNLVQQHQVSSGSAFKSGLSGNSLSNNSNHSNSNSSANNINNNNSIFPGHGHSSLSKQSMKPKATAGKSPSGRGLASFPVIREGLLGKGSGPVDYTRYVRRYSNSAECGYQQCRELNYREHFHCLDCGEGARVFVKKEEMIRHFKWHKKRDESLQHGFMRYSPMDDCSDRFRNCTHNRKQTHYHCLQDGCEKVYISTSDVQMHANYHRKDSAIIQEGFQRFRAAEDCGADHCSFRHQRTTHFHCRRASCSYTFKNKADMEKHKSYHIKDEQLNRDGFKKFMKHEACHYSNCRFSRVCNHIHCIREGCNYVLHSSGQLYSHKRKHERRDSELAYRKFKLAQSLMRGTFGAELSALNLGDSYMNASRSEEENSRSSNNDHNTEPLDAEELVKKFVLPCSCDASDEEHFHCKIESCANALLGTTESASEHGRNHELEDRISALAYFTVDPANFDAQDSTIPCISAKCPYQTREKHYHCLWDGCSEIIVSGDGPFKRLEHFKAHEYSQKLDLTDKCDSLDGFFRRKRGRPPKNRIIEVSSGANEAIFTSFKLPKPIFGGALDNADTSDNDVKDRPDFVSYHDGMTCPDSSCSFNTSTSTHYHCGHPRCHFSVTDVHKLSLHLRDFHSNVDILEGYAYYDKNSDCRETHCEFNGQTEHFHCMRDGIGFLLYSAMIAHEQEYHDHHSNKSNNGSSDDEDKPWTNQIVKASGTFYPMPTIQKKEAAGDAVDLSSSNGLPDTPESKPVTDHSLSRILQLPSPDSGETQFGPDVACGRPFCKLKKKCHFHCHLCNQAFSDLDKLRPHVVKHSNFSPLKPANESEDLSGSDDDSKNDSDEPMSDLKLFPKVNKDETPMTPIKLEGVPSTSFTPTSIQNFLSSYPGNPHSPYLFLQQNPLTSLYAGMMFGGAAAAGFPPAGVLTPPTPPTINVPVPTSNGTAVVTGNGIDQISPLQLNPTVLQQLPTTKVTKRPPSASSSSPSSPPDKKQRLQMRILKDEPVPDGYIRFRFNEDCQYTHCGYREHQTHFHCTREDCGYSFCDKTRFVQHTARHERLDTLMGGDFKQYRANISCGRVNCSYVPNISANQGQNKASHFHCSKCDFVCTDTNKVVAHRRQHQKLDSIMAAGFEKFTPSQHCHIEACIHAQKQTHYHCLKCSYAVLGLSQMSAHKYRHVD